MFFLWFFFHVVFAFVLFFNKRLQFFFSIIVFFPIALIYLVKEPTYDLVFYYKYFENAWTYLEPGFRFLVLILNKLLAANSFLIHIAFQFISMLLIFYTSKKLFFDENQKKKNFYLFIPVTVITFYTLFYLLGSQNNLRQFIAFIISFIGFLYLLNNQKIKSLLLFALSMTFHFASIFYFPLFFLIKIFKNQRLLIYCISFFGGILIYSIMVMYLSDHYGVQFYMTFQDQAGFEKDRSGLIKIILLSLIIFVTNFIFKSCKEFSSESIKLLLTFRMTLFSYILIFAMTGLYELWSRIIFAFYFIDLLLISYIAFIKTTQKYRFSCVLIILSYAIAPNAKNILSG